MAIEGMGGRYAERARENTAVNILSKLQATFPDMYRWPNFMCFLGLHNRVSTIYSMHRVGATTNRSEVWKLYCAVELVSVAEASKLVAMEVESRSQTPSLRFRCRHVALALCAHYIDESMTTFYHMHHNHGAATGDMVKSFIVESNCYMGMHTLKVYGVYNVITASILYNLGLVDSYQSP